MTYTYKDFVKNAKKKKIYIPTPSEYRFYLDTLGQFAFATKGLVKKFVIKKGSSIVLNNHQIEDEKSLSGMGVTTEKDETFPSECFNGITMCGCCPNLIAHFQTAVLPNIDVTTNPSNIDIV